MQQIKTVDLTPHIFAARTWLDERNCSISNLDIKIWEEIAVKKMVYDLRATVYGREMDKIEVKYPASAWDHVKQELPVWISKRLEPVRYTTKVITAQELYPKVSAPDKQPVVRLHMHPGF